MRHCQRGDEHYHASLNAFRKFCENLPKQGKRGNIYEPFVGEIWFNDDDDLTENLRIWLSSDTIDFGRIVFEEGEILNAETVHTSFHPRRQNYSLEPGNLLCIRDNMSPRMGKYKVKIRFAGK